MYGHFVTMAANAASAPAAGGYAAFVRAANKHGARRVRFGQPVPGLGLGIDPYYWDYVSIDDLDYLDARIQQLHTDIFSTQLGDPPNPLTEPEKYNAWEKRSAWLRGFRWSWTSFHTRWGQWRENVSGNPLFRWGSDAQASYDEARGMYNEKLREFRANMGEKSTAAAPAGGAAERKREAGGEDISGAVKLASVALIALAGVWLYGKMKE